MGVVREKVGWLLTHFVVLGRGARDRSPLVTFLSRDQEQPYAEVPLFQVPAATQLLISVEEGRLETERQSGGNCPIARQLQILHCLQIAGKCSEKKAFSPLCMWGKRSSGLCLWEPIQPRKGKTFCISAGQAAKETRNMEKFYKENEGKPENKGRSEDERSTEEGGKADEDKSDAEGKPARQGKLEEEGGPGEPGQPQDEGKSGNQGKSEGEGKRQGEGKHESQAKPASEARAAEKRPAEDYVPRKAKRKTDRMTDDSPKNSQEDLQDRHVSSEEMMRECADVTRAQEELRKRQKMGGFHWMPSPQDALVPRGQRGVRGVRGGGGRGQKDLEDAPFV
ncbi:transcription elongation factor A SII-like 5 [Sigmodon hispidus]